jgi:hypothetical protein
MYINAANDYSTIVLQCKYLQFSPFAVRGWSSSSVVVIRNSRDFALKKTSTAGCCTFTLLYKHAKVVDKVAKIALFSGWCGEIVVWSTFFQPRTHYQTFTGKTCYCCTQPHSMDHCFFKTYTKPINF